MAHPHCAPQQFELVTLNFSSTSKPDLLMKTFDHYCKVRLAPTSPSPKHNHITHLITAHHSHHHHPSVSYKGSSSLTWWCFCLQIERTPNGFRMVPNVKNKWLVIFCDEINLPMNDNYGTQIVITFLRQITEQV